MNEKMNIDVQIQRGDTENESRIETYNVDVDKKMVVLDALHEIQAFQVPDLAVRWNCKAGKCGSCSAEINGKPRLMCMTRMGEVIEEMEEGNVKSAVFWERDAGKFQAMLNILTSISMGPGDYLMQ